MPLTFDMPLEALKLYTGTNPMPDDFDAFWDLGMLEMQAIGVGAELEDAAFQVPFARCSHLYYTGVGGARIHARYVHPNHGPDQKPDPKPAVILFHGYGSRAPDWVEMLGYAAMGCVVAAMDCRGQGGFSEDLGGARGTTFAGQLLRGIDDVPEQMLFRQIFLDAAQLVGILMAMPGVDEKQVHVAGCSQGGGLALACAALEPRVRRAAAVYPFLCDYKRVWEVDLCEGAYGEIPYYFRYFDPAHQREEEIFQRLGYIDVQFLCPRIRCEVLMVTCLMDRVCPPSTQFAAYNRIPGKKQVRLYPDFGHEDVPGLKDLLFRYIVRSE